MQYGRPSSDIENPGGWATEPLWDKIEEEPFDDGDYIESPKSAAGASFTIGLSGVVDPEVHTGHIVRIRVKTGVSGTFKYELMQGAVVIKDSGDVVLTTAFTEYNMTLSEAEAANITDYSALRVRVTAVGTQKNQRQNVSWIRFECPDAAANEFIYSGDVPLGVLPGMPKGPLSKSYVGNILMSALPSFTSILNMVYGGGIPVVIQPSAPLASLSKSYVGDVGLMLVPNSAYELVEGANEYVYAGAVLMTVLPAYTSILDRVYSGDIPMIALPGYSSILDRVYGGSIPMTLTPDYLSVLDRIYAGAVTMSALPGYSSILDRVYAGDVDLIALPDSPVAPLSKSYGGDIDCLLTPVSIYELISGGGEFIYAGDIPLVTLPSHGLIMDRVYRGGIALSVLSDSPKALLEKVYMGEVAFALAVSSLTSLERRILEYLYAGNIPLSVFVSQSSVLAMSYKGDISIIAIPASSYSGVRAALDSYPPVIPRKKEEELALIGQKEPVFISKE